MLSVILLALGVVTQARPAEQGYKRFEDPKFGISFELPSTWAYRVTPAKDYLFEGPKGTDTYELSIVVQFVAKAANRGSSAEAQSSGLIRKVLEAPEGLLKTFDTLDVAGRTSPFFVATYAAADAGGTTTIFAHAQIVVDHGDYYYLISYSGPKAIYQQHIGVFQRMVETFRLSAQ